jgi:predicted ATPase with chaperone activity
LGILGANGDLGRAESLENTLSVGELSLDGRVRPVRGALSIALRARENGVKNLLLPEEMQPKRRLWRALTFTRSRICAKPSTVPRFLGGGAPRVAPLKVRHQRVKKRGK